MLQAHSSMAEVKHSYTQTTGAGSHKIGVSIDVFSTKKDPEPISSKVKSNRVKVLTPLAEKKPVPKYHIDINAIQKNIDKLAMAKQMKSEGFTPRDLYLKANPGLFGSPVDYTDPRQWYSSSSSKKMMTKMTKTFEENAKKSQRKAKNTDTLMTRNDTMAKSNVAAFYVNFPNLTKSDIVHMNKTQNSQKSSSDNNTDKLPIIRTTTNMSKGDMEKEKTQVQIKRFSPNIEESLSARHRRDLFSSTESLDSIGRTKTKASKSRQIKRSNILFPQMEKHSNVTIEFENAETPPSALDRELTKSMEDILRSVTVSDNVQRSLRQPPNASIKLPQIIKTEDIDMKTKETVKSYPGDDSRNTSAPNWETGVGLRKTYSYQSLNDYSNPSYRCEEEELSTRLMKATSQESLVQNRDKFKKLRLPQQKAAVEEITSFRSNYNLRQKSVLKLKMRSGFDPEKIPMNKIHVSKSQSQDEYDDVQSKVAPYIESKPQRFVVAPDGKGDINPMKFSPEGKPAGLTKPTLITEITPCPGTSFSQLPNDDSSEVYTLKSMKSGDVSGIKPKESQRSRSKSRSKSRNRSQSRSKSRDGAKSEEDTKPRKGTLSRGSTISKHSTKHSRPASKNDYKKGSGSVRTEESKPLPSARSPSSKKVHLLPTSKVKESKIKIPPPSQQVTKSYIPPKLKKYRHTYVDSLDALVRKNGHSSRNVAISVAVKEKSVKRRKQLIRAFDKYLLTKLGDKVDEDNTDIEEKVTQSAELPRPPPEPGKRPVFRRMKSLIPFDERGRPITRGKDKPVVNEDFPNRVYKPSRRPPSYKLDLRQYPTVDPGPLIRDITFDKRSGAIINHGLERSMTIGELAFPEKKTESEVSRSENASTISNLQGIKVKHKKGSYSKRPPRTRGTGSYMDKKYDKQTESDMDSRFGSSVDGSRQLTETPADSITASMMKEIYENLNDYLEEDRDQGVQYEPPEMAHKEIMMEG